MASALWDDVITISSLKISAGGEKNACKVVSQEVGHKNKSELLLFLLLFVLVLFPELSRSTA